MTDDNDLAGWEFGPLESRHQSYQNTIKLLEEQVKKYQAHSVRLNDVLYQLAVMVGLVEQGGTVVTSDAALLDAVYERLC